MHGEPPSSDELADLRRIANFQFGAGAGEALLPPDGEFAAIRTSSGRIEQCYAVEGVSAGEGRSADAASDDPVSDDAGAGAGGRPTGPDGEPAGERLFTQATDGRFVLSVAGARRLAAGLEHPRHRVVVGEESVPFVREGRNAMAKFVREVDPGIRPGDEAVVVHEEALLGVGRAELSADAMADFETGVAVFVRHGAGD